MDERQEKEKLLYITSHVVDRDENRARNREIKGLRPLLEGEQPQPEMHIVRYGGNMSEKLIIPALIPGCTAPSGPRQHEPRQVQVQEQRQTQEQGC
jgi:hypothetical protein